MNDEVLELAFSKFAWKKSKNFSQTLIIPFPQPYVKPTQAPPPPSLQVKNQQKGPSQDASSTCAFCDSTRVDNGAA